MYVPNDLSELDAVNQETGTCLDVILAKLKLLLSNQWIRPIDFAFGQFLLQKSRKQLAQNDSELTVELVIMLAVFTSERLGKQHSCLALDELVKHIDNEQTPQVSAVGFKIPSLGVCIEALENSPLVHSTRKHPSQENPNKPLILENSKLYLQRYWHYEKQLACDLFRLTAIDSQTELQCIKRYISGIFPDTASPDVVDWQKVAVVIACLNAFTVVTGGPGTGKTTTVVKIVWTLCHLLAKRKLKVHLAAPTGKAVARLLESVEGAILSLPNANRNGDSFELGDNIMSMTATTVHRLLGVVPNSPFFRHNSENPINTDILIVDEASMLDLPLLSKLLQAIPSSCRVILLGDKDQLASVDVGSVLADICALKSDMASFTAQTMEALFSVAGQPQHALICKEQSRLADALVELKVSYRFSADSQIGRLAKAVNQGEVANTLALLNLAKANRRAITAQELNAELTWWPEYQYADLLNLLEPHLQRYFEAVGEGDVKKCFGLLKKLQVLTLTNQGEWGKQALENVIEQFIKGKLWAHTELEVYAGKPIMVLENDAGKHIYNGDIGIVLPDKANPHILLVWFEQFDGSYRNMLPTQLPSFASIYAITTHKSQGSEYEHVIMCLPSIASRSVLNMLNRELIYTGITRAKKQFVLMAKATHLKVALSKRSNRASGLSERLLNG